MRLNNRKTLPLPDWRGRVLAILVLLIILSVLQRCSNDSSDMGVERLRSQTFNTAVNTETIKSGDDPVNRKESSPMESHPVSGTQAILVIYPEIVKLHQIRLPIDTSAKTISQLQPMLYSFDPAVRLTAMESIAELDSPETLPLLINALNDYLPSIRRASIEGLSLRVDSDIAGAIEPFLFDSDISVKMAAIDALAIVGGEQAIGSLASLLNDYDPAVRNRAVNALGEIDSAKSGPYLFPLQFDPDPRVRYNVEAILVEQSEAD